MDLKDGLGLAGKVAIVAGGGARGEGIGNGRAAAILLARAGASVFVVDRDGALAQNTVDMIAAEDGAVLVVDEAHATGLYGDRGQGRAHGLDASVDLVSLHTCGKALGAAGGLVCADPVLIDTLVNRARNFVFSTAPSPLDAAVVRAALRLVAERADLRDAAWSNIRRAHEAARRASFGPF